MDIQAFHDLLEDGEAEHVETNGPVVVEIIEGLEHDLEQRDLLPGTILEVRSLLAEFEARGRMLAELKEYLAGARAIVIQLINHGYPELPSREFPPEAYDDLNQNRETIEAAQKQMLRKQDDEAVGGEVVVEESSGSGRMRRMVLENDGVLPIGVNEPHGL